MAGALSSTSKTVVDVLNRLAKWLLLVAIIWLCWGLAKVLWLLLAPPQAPNLSLAPLQIKQVPQVNANTALSIFENKAPAPTQVQTPPPNVELAGVMLATPNALSSAMLVVDGKMANYRLGEMLEGTAYKLIDVAWNAAIIADDSDRQIMIEMPSRMDLDQGNMSAQNSQGAIGNRRLSPRGSRRDSVNAMLNQSSNNNPEINEDVDINQLNRIKKHESGQVEAEQQNAESMIDTAVDELKQNPASYLSSMGVMATGEGYQVTSAMPAKIRKRLGLENGDRVLSVNGQNVGNNPSNDADLLNQVKRSGEATIKVQRGEQIITVRQQF